MGDISIELQQTVQEFFASRSPLKIVGGNTKGFYGRETEAALLDISGHQGIVNYQPTELVITARAGTALAEIETTLAEKNQMLAFEPPYFGDRPTWGGTVACGLSGPRRPFAGAVRDFVLGCKLLSGKGEILSFGGEVMKNVAGYDVSRLMAGALGTLGVLLEISVKVLPKPPVEKTFAYEMDFDQAIDTMNAWCGQPMTLSALCFDGHRVFARLSGSDKVIASAQKRMGGDPLSEQELFWKSVGEQSHPFFTQISNLWRLSLAPGSPKPDLPGEWFLDWGGAQRWLKTPAESGDVFRIAAEIGGHATLFRSSRSGVDRFQPQSQKLMQLHRNLKQAFDPMGILNPGRMYSDL